MAPPQKMAGAPKVYAGDTQWAGSTPRCTNRSVSAVPRLPPRLWPAGGAGGAERECQDGPRFATVCQGESA